MPGLRRQWLPRLPGTAHRESRRQVLPRLDQDRMTGLLGAVVPAGVKATRCSLSFISLITPTRMVSFSSIRECSGPLCCIGLTFLRGHCDERRDKLCNVRPLAMRAVDWPRVMFLEGYVDHKLPVTGATRVFIGWHTVSPVCWQTSVRRSMPCTPRASARGIPGQAVCCWRGRAGSYRHQRHNRSVGDDSVSGQFACSCDNLSPCSGMYFSAVGNTVRTIAATICLRFWSSQVSQGIGAADKTCGRHRVRRSWHRVCSPGLMPAHNRHRCAVTICERRDLLGKP